VDQFVFRGFQVVAGAVEASVVVPVDPFQGGEFDVVETAPGAAVVDQFGFEQANFGFGQRVVQRVTDGADAGGDAGFGEALGECDGGVLDPASLWCTSPAKSVTPWRPRAHIAISSASNSSSVVMLVAARQPRIRRENASRTNAT
jgi:hypothetical protein